MKRFKLSGLAAAVFAAAVNLNGCVYGPPPESGAGDGVQTADPAQTTAVSSEEEQETTSRTLKYQDSYDPADNDNEEVYGPPEYFGYVSEPEEEFDPEKNMIECVYGPPEDFGIEPEEQGDIDLDSEGE